MSDDIGQSYRANEKHELKNTAQHYPDVRVYNACSCNNAPKFREIGQCPLRKRHTLVSL